MTFISSLTVISALFAHLPTVKIILMSALLVASYVTTMRYNYNNNNLMEPCGAVLLGGRPCLRSVHNLLKINIASTVSKTSNTDQPADKSTLTTDSLMLKTVAHMRSIYSNHTCSSPVPQLFRISQLVASHDRQLSRQLEYYPSSVLLNQCSDSSGCCPLQHQRCEALRSRAVRREFLIIRNYVGAQSALQSYYKRLEFIEHSKCHCTIPHSAFPDDLDVCVNDFTRAQRRNKCLCPSNFILRHSDGGDCVCDCFDGDRKCLREKRGHTALSNADQKCVAVGRCTIPQCSYGIYSHDHQKCPSIW